MNGQTQSAIVIGRDSLVSGIAAELSDAGFAVETGIDGSATDVELVVAVLATDIEPHDFATLEEGDWIRLAEEPLAETRRIFANLSERVRAPGGAILVVLPNIGMSGAIPGVAAQSMATEGIRSLLKAIAKGWHGRGIRVNCAMLSPAQLTARDASLAVQIAGLAVATGASGFTGTGNSIFIDGEHASI